MQVEDRLRFYEDGVAPEKNVDVMKRTLAALGGSDLADTAAPKSEKKSVRFCGRTKMKGFDFCLEEEEA